MKTIGQFRVLLCVIIVAVSMLRFVHCTLYVRTPLLDKAEVHTERIGGSFAYKTTELLAYSPIVYKYNVPNVPCTFALVLYCQYPWFVHTGTDSKTILELQAEADTEPETEADTPEPVHDSVVTLDDNDTVVIHASDI